MHRHRGSASRGANGGSAVGPVEEAGTRTRPPAGPEDTGRAGDAREGGPREELWAPGGPRPGEWWAALPRAGRGLISGAVALAVAAGGIAYAAAHRPPPPEPVAAPWPTNVTAVAFEAVHGPVGGGETFSVHMRFDVAPSARVPVTVTSVSQEYRSLSTKTMPSTPITVKPGESRRLTMIVRVRDCAHTPVFAGMPLVNVTLSNDRAIRTRSEIFGDEYAHALSSALHSLCPTVVKQ